MTKTQKVLEHLKVKKSITSMEAFKLYGATRLSAIIFVLRKRGYDIATLDYDYTDEDGRPIRYGKYYLRNSEV